MGRWGRRWASGEANKDQLKLILDDAVQSADAVKGTTSQLIGDFYGACMNLELRNAFGVKPVRPLLAEIDAVKTSADLQRILARLQMMAVTAPFNVASGSDNHNPNDVLIQVQASGLGMPDRDYYWKSEPRFEETRQQVPRPRGGDVPAGGIRREGGEGVGPDRLSDGEGAGRSLARQRGLARSEGHRPQDDDGRAPEADAAAGLGRRSRGRSTCRRATSTWRSRSSWRR